ncbi:hypothetical protein CYB_2907 [Synechococcus sp. JA-2-3B'a(2-13)]|nr:hypothetical protein CYB_2907 [Synechococcus sp. JA-2-3B'a(2-13)]
MENPSHPLIGLGLFRVAVQLFANSGIPSPHNGQGAGSACL